MTIGNSLNKAGAVTTKIGVYVGGTLTLIMFLVTLFIANKITKSPYKALRSTISDSTCTKSTKNVCKTKNKVKTCTDTDIFTCDINVKYNVNSKDYEKKFNHQSSKQMNKDDYFNIEYNSKNPSDSRKPGNLKAALMISSVITIFLFLGTLIKYIMSKSRLGRQLNAGGTAFKFAKNILN